MGTKDAKVSVKMMYVFHPMLLIRIGVIMTIVKFQIQWLDTEMAVPRALASRGRISGPHTHGTTFTVAPKISMYKKKKAIAAEDVFFSPIESRIVIIIIQKDKPAQPLIMIFLRPSLSRANAGKVLPTTNMSSTNPAISCASFAPMPTFFTN